MLLIVALSESSPREGTALRKLSAYLLAISISLMVLGWSGRPAAAVVQPGFEAKQELAIPTDPVAPPSTDNSDASSVDVDVTVGGVRADSVSSDPGVFGRIRAWFGTHGKATAKGAAVGLVVGGLFAAGAVALGVVGAPILLIVGAGVLGGAIYGASVGNADFNWLEAGATALLSSITTLAGGVAAAAGRAGASGTSAVGRGLIGSITRGAAGGSVRSGIVNAALDAVDAYETVAIVTDEEANWQEKAVAGLGLLPLGVASKAARHIADNLPKEIREVGSSEYAKRLGFKRFTENNYRKALIKHTGGKNPGKAFQAHHVFPQEFKDIFKDTDFTIHDPRFMAWWESGSHQEHALAYNQAWRIWFRDHPNPTPEQTIQAAQDIMANFGRTADFWEGSYGFF